MTLEKLKEIFDHNFNPPFLAEGMVKTRWIEVEGKERQLEIKIGRRDIWIDENGLTGAGTDMTREA